ncbi:hypothetical protein Gotri_000538 [Gossypium trilobum]|uniref:Uncharacterized protein n=1 Tax=Gossypium trilobum TaxID=34281 RepID=A0A7J9FBK6_9ROSI|nr:hypothetical protein [Gossypium trilobum]
MHWIEHYVLAGATRIDRNELVQPVRAKFFSSAEKWCLVFRNVIEIGMNRPRNLPKNKKVEREGGGEKKGIEGTAVGIVGIEGMLGRGGSPLGNVVGSGGSAPGFGKLGKYRNGGKEKGIGGIAVGIVGTKGMLGRGGSPVGNVVGSGGNAPGHRKDGRDGVGRLGKDGKLCV